MTPLYVTIDGVQKELTSLPGMVDGVQKDMSSLLATVDGVAREVFAKATASILPSVYTQLEYIESTGAEYIDTEFKPNQDTRVVMDAQLVRERTAEAANALFGVRTSISSKAYSIHYNTSNGYLYHFYNNGYTGNLTIEDKTNRLVYETDKNTFKTTGGSWNNSTNARPYASFQCDYNLYLFALNNAGATSFFSCLRLYSCKIYDGAVLIRDYVPCKNQTGEYGLYDLVNGEFYGNAGTGAFTGSDVEIISFTIDGVSYQAENGMTLAEWLDSEYNTTTAGWHAESDGVIWDNGNMFNLCDEDGYAYATAVIIAGREYFSM